MIYVYRCRECGGEFEREESIRSAPLTECALCPSGTVRRVPQVPQICYYGPGFHVNDYGKRFKED